MLQKRSLCSQALKGLFQLVTTNWRIARLSSCSEQNEWKLNSTSELTTILTSWVKKNRTSIQTTFSDFPSPTGRHPKVPVYALHRNRQAASKELPAPLAFTHPFLVVLQCSFWGEGTRECQSIQLFEWAHSVARSTIQTVWWCQSRGHCHGGAGDHSWKPEWVGKHLVPASAMPSGFQLGDWR